MNSVEPKRRWRAIFSLLLMVFVGNLSALADESPGLHEAIGTLEFAGNETFESDSIRKALLQDTKIQKAVSGTNSFDRDVFARLVCEQILAGYQSLAYKQATVTTTVSDSPDALKVLIVEGPEQRRGVVKVEAPAGFAVAELETAITGLRDGKFVRADFLGVDGKCTDRFPPVWTIGDPPDDLNKSIETATESVQRWFDMQGLLFPEFIITTAESPDHATVDLLVQVTDCGPRLSISKVVFTGLERHTESELREFLQLPETIHYSDKFRRELTAKLEDSGRFRATSVWPEIPFGPDQAVVLHVDVQESFHAPKLGEPLSDAETAIISLTNWLKHWHEGNDDILVELKYTIETGRSVTPEGNVQRLLSQLVLGTANANRISAKAVLSPGGDVILTVNSRSRDGRETTPRRIVANDDGFGLSAAGGPSWWFCPREGKGLQIAVSVRSNEHINPEKESAAKLDFHTRPGLPQALDLRMGGPAAVLIDDLHESGIVNPLVKNADGTVTLIGADMALVINGETGRVKLATYRSRGIEVKVTVQPGLYNDAILELEKETSQQNNFAIRGQMLASGARFLLSEYANDLRFDRLETEANLVEAFALGKPAEQLMADLVRISATKAFSIPSDEAEKTLADGTHLTALTSELEQMTQNLRQLSEPKSEMTDEKIQDALNDSELVAGMEQKVREQDSLFAVIRYLIAVGQSLEDAEGERLAVLIEEGEIAPATAGINIRPFWRILQAEKGQSPEEAFTRVFPVLWSSLLKKYFSAGNVSLTGGSGGKAQSFQVIFQSGKPETPIRTRLDSSKPEKQDIDDFQLEDIEIPSLDSSIFRKPASGFPQLKPK